MNGFHFLKKKMKNSFEKVPFLLVLFSMHPTNITRGMQRKENERKFLQGIENHRFTKK
jgi:hypothetical protein